MLRDKRLTVATVDSPKRTAFPCLLQDNISTLFMNFVDLNHINLHVSKTFYVFDDSLYIFEESSVSNDIDYNDNSHKF